MEKKVLQEYVEKNYSLNDMAREADCAQSTIRHWMQKYGLKTQRRPHNKGYHLDRLCSHCGETDESKFYGHKRTICGKCHCQYTLKKGQEKRIFAIEMLGGKCINCGFDKWTCSLDFHHVDPKIKDKKFDSMRSWSKERIEKEIKNCVLLCANCHRAVHKKEINI